MNQRDRQTGRLRHIPEVRDVAQRLTAARTQAGLNRTDAAKRIGVSRQALTSWEDCTSRPSRDHIRRAARVYAVDEAQLQPGGVPAVTLSAATRPDVIPRAITVWIHAYILQLAEQGIPIARLDEVRAFLLSPGVQRMVAPDPLAGRTHSDAAAIAALEGIAQSVVLPLLREWGHHV